VKDECGDTARVAAMQTFKLLMQTVVNEDAHFMTIDIKDFYIQHALKEKKRKWRYNYLQWFCESGCTTRVCEEECTEYSIQGDMTL